MGAIVRTLGLSKGHDEDEMYAVEFLRSTVLQDKILILAASFLIELEDFEGGPDGGSSNYTTVSSYYK